MANRPEQSELGQFIPLHYHFNMLNDVARTGGFKAALEEVVPPGGLVVELGGGTGVLSFFASAKAERVWCVELNPELANAARGLLERNHAGNVEVVEADAMTFLPPEPVDVVVCEMLHVGLLREKQIQVIASFKDRYRREFGPPLPHFVPEGLVQAIQPVQQSFDFYGYDAPAPFFQDGSAEQPRTVELGDPVVTLTFLYEAPLPEGIAWRGPVAIAQSGTLNAVRTITKNLLALVPEEGRSIDWVMQYLVVPLAEPLAVRAGDAIEVSFAYRPGDPIGAFAPTARRL